MTIRCSRKRDPVVCPIDLECRFTNEVPDFEGRFVKDTDKDIIAYLKEHNLLVKRENYLHSYPFCYRTKKPLIYRAMSCWFVDVNKIKQYMLSSNEQITWMPDHLKYGRFGKWLEGARDWAISRNRFWGNPIPVWKCDGSDHIEVIGSVAELEAKCGKKVEDLHKHFVDDLTWPSPDGKGTMRRIGDVLDCCLSPVRCPMPSSTIRLRTRSTLKVTSLQISSVKDSIRPVVGSIPSPSLPPVYGKSLHSPTASPTASS